MSCFLAIQCCEVCLSVCARVTMIYRPPKPLFKTALLTWDRGPPAAAAQWKMGLSRLQKATEKGVNRISPLVRPHAHTHSPPGALCFVLAPPFYRIYVLYLYCSLTFQQPFNSNEGGWIFIISIYLGPCISSFNFVGPLCNNEMLQWFFFFPPLILSLLRRHAADWSSGLQPEAVRQLPRWIIMRRN